MAQMSEGSSCARVARADGCGAVRRVNLGDKPRDAQAVAGKYAPATSRGVGGSARSGCDEGVSA